MFEDDAPFPDKPAAFIPRPAKLPGTDLSEEEVERAQRLSEELTTPTSIEIRSGMEDVRYLSEIGDLMKDAKLLRAYSVRKNRTTGIEEIYNPLMFEKSMARRTAILSTAVRLVRDIWNQKAMEDFYRSVVDAACMESPLMRRRIMDRLQELNGPVADAASRWPVTITQSK